MRHQYSDPREEHEQHLEAAWIAFGGVLAGSPLPIDVSKYGHCEYAVAARHAMAEVNDPGLSLPEEVRAQCQAFINAWFSAHVLSLQVVGTMCGDVAVAAESAYVAANGVMEVMIKRLADWSAGRRLG